MNSELKLRVEEIAEECSVPSWDGYGANAVTAAALAEARAFVEQGWVGDFNELLAEALRSYLESHSTRLAESFIREDVAWGLRGRE